MKPLLDEAAPENDGRESLLTIGSNRIRYLLSTVPRPAIDSPASPVPKLTVICLHGSGDTHASWLSFHDQLLSSHGPDADTASLYLLLYTRPSASETPMTSVSALRSLLTALHLSPPFILIAHSYGGIIAREFLQYHCDEVAGVVLVETGQETPSPWEKEQHQRQILGNRPLVVIRGNSLIGKQKQQQQQQNTSSTKPAAPVSSVLNAEYQRLMKQWDRQDEMLKREQMKLSKNAKWIQVQDCGHHVVRDKPGAVVEGVDWVLSEHLARTGATADTHAIVGAMGDAWKRYSLSFRKNWISGVRKKISSTRGLGK